MRTKVIDKSKCMGCKNCELACTQARQQESTFSQLMESQFVPNNKVKLDKNENPFPQFCQHCANPACIQACKTGALTKTEEGFVVCDADKCVGCYLCVKKCPFGMAKPGLNGIKKMQKCDGCVDKDCMACVAACPSGCISVIEGEKKAVVLKRQA